jgi:anti-sigma factor RsiW
MRPHERHVAGLTCAEVMVDLSGYLDGELSPERAAQLEAHVRECQTCAQFGSGFSTMIARVRERLASPDAVPAEVAMRLRARLADH